MAEQRISRSIRRLPLEQVEELRRKSEQTSQQLIGEVQEMELEAILRAQFPKDDFERFRKSHPATGERIMRNLAQLLAERLIAANTKLNTVALRKGVNRKAAS